MTSPDPTNPLAIAQGLIRCPSVTPHEAGALDYLQSLLAPAGFSCQRLPFSEAGTPDVDNLFARRGAAGPHLCFAGHTDVVPPGDESAWTFPPFGGVVDGGWLYGRGAVDMKGGVACFVAAVMRCLEKSGGALPGSISFLITGDEEGPAVNGTRKVLDWMDLAGHRPDHCLVGEPSCPEELGDSIKIGRRGSLSGRLTVIGKAGHVAYPELARNPIPGMLAVLDAFLADPLDSGNDDFAASNLEVTSIETGNRAENVIPASIMALFNIRFNTEQTAEGLKDRLRGQAQDTLEGTGIDHELSFEPASDCFLTERGPLIDIMVESIRAVTGKRAELSTAGGTSDARFIKDYCPVIEFGHVNATIHQTDERVRVEDLERLTAIYEDFINRYFAAFANQR
ncbi:MAG: succinyl-diaminopimelate desuccinylase [Methyloligellaceae bacterium]